MSNKRKKIVEANLLSEQRYLNNKFISEGEDPQTANQELTTAGVNLSDATTHNSILQQLAPYSDKVKLDILRPHIGKESFFNELKTFVNVVPETSNLEPKSITGQEVKLKLPGGINLKGSFDLGQGGKITGFDDIGIQKNLNVGGTPVNLGVKYNDPVSGNFNLNNVRVGAKVTIPQTQKKSSGYRL